MQFFGTQNKTCTKTRWNWWNRCSQKTGLKVSTSHTLGLWKSKTHPSSWIAVRQTWQQPMPGSTTSQWQCISCCDPQDVQCGWGTASDLANGFASHSVEHASDCWPSVWGGFAQRLLLVLRCTWSAFQTFIWTDLWWWYGWYEVLVPVCSCDQVRSLCWQHHHLRQDQFQLAGLEHTSCRLSNSMCRWWGADRFQAPACQQQVPLWVQSHRQGRDAHGVHNWADPPFMAKIGKMMMEPLDLVVFHHHFQTKW